MPAAERGVGSRHPAGCRGWEAELCGYLRGVDESRLVELVFVGGPWDGHELAGESQPEARLAVPGGRYELRETRPSESAAYRLVAEYAWVPAAVSPGG